MQLTRRLAIAALAVVAFLAAPSLRAQTPSNTDGTAFSCASATGGNGAVCGLSTQQGTTDTLSCATINVTETQFATTYQIPANYFVANRALRLTVGISDTTSGTPVTQRFRVRLGSVGIGGATIYDSAAQTTRSNLTASIYGWTIITTGSAAAGASVNTFTTLYSGPGNLVQTNSILNNQQAQPVLIATNAAQNINVTLLCGGNTAGNSVTLNQFLVEGIN